MYISLNFVVCICWYLCACVGVYVHVLVFMCMCWCLCACVGVHADDVNILGGSIHTVKKTQKLQRLLGRSLE